MKRRGIYLIGVVLGLLVLGAAAAFAAGCSEGGDGHESREGAEEHGGRQHGGEGGQQGGEEEGEESAEQLGKGDTYDHARGGARLILTYSAEENAFMGTVENTTDGTLARVRVEVHLSNGVELGPTTPGDLGPGESRAIRLAASDEGFETWSAHPEVGEEQAGHQAGG